MEINNYKISTIIPVYNSEKHIEEAIKSVINQTYKPYEIIIVNDNSGDYTLNKCEGFKEIFDNLKIVNLNKNMGVSNARNIGTQNASGDYIHFMDSDDNIELNMYEIIIKKIDDKAPDLIITGTRYNEDGKIKIYEPPYCNINTYKEMSNFIKANCISGRRDIFNVVWNKLYKRQFILENDIRFDKEISFGEDFLFNCLCMKKTNSIYVIDKAYYNYMRRTNEQTLKMKFLKNKIELRRLFYKEWIELYKFYNVYEDVAKEMEIYEGFKIYMAIISLTNEDCFLNYKEKIEYINQFLKFENSNCLFNYMESREELKTELKYLKQGEIDRFYNNINNKR